MLKKIFQWIVYSSANPTKVSLTLKGAGVTVIGFLVPVIGLTHIAIGGDPSTVLNSILDSIASIVQVALTLVGAIVGLYGLVRKVWLTVTGQNI
jgi:hypothetical protein